MVPSDVVQDNCSAELRCEDANVEAGQLILREDVVADRVQMDRKTHHSCAPWLGLLHLPECHCIPETTQDTLLFWH